jgi:homoserine O-acetyltransferase
MGGMNAWQWAEAYPDMMDGVMPVVSLPIPVSGRNLLWRRMVIDSIRSDLQWKNGKLYGNPVWMDRGIQYSADDDRQRFGSPARGAQWRSSE